MSEALEEDNQIALQFAAAGSIATSYFMQDAYFPKQAISMFCHITSTAKLSLNTGCNDSNCSWTTNMSVFNGGAKVLVPIKGNCCCNARHPAYEGDGQRYVCDQSCSLDKVVACLSGHEASLILSEW